MVPVSQTIVDKRTMMVEELHTLVADSAMERGLRLDDFAEGAKVVEMHA